MGHLFEIAFEDVEPGTIEALVGSMLPLQANDRERIRAFLTERESDGLSIPPTCTTIGDVTISDISAHIYRYSGKYDVEFAWDLAAVADEAISTMIASVHAAAISVANTYGVSDYYGGLEPWVDEDTRVFTRQQRGPLMLGGTDP